jgi:membrane protease YdiL (CAAX protease family)
MTRLLSQFVLSRYARHKLRQLHLAGEAYVRWTPHTRRRILRITIMTKSFSINFGIGLCVLLGALQLLFGFGFGLFLVFNKLSTNQLIYQLGTILIELLTFGLVFLIAFYKIDKKLNEIIRFNPVKPVTIICAIFFSFGFVIISSEFDNLFQSLLPMPLFLKSVFNNIIFSKSFILAAFIIAAMPALVEEIFFRGILITGLMQKHTSAKSIVISSLLFSLIHLNPWQSIPAFVLGLLFGYIFVRSNSIVICMVIHFIYNFISFLVARYPDIFIHIGISSIDYNGKLQPLWIDVTGLMVVSIGLGLLLKSIDNNKITNI